MLFKQLKIRTKLFIACISITSLSLVGHFAVSTGFVTFHENTIELFELNRIYGEAKDMVSLQKDKELSIRSYILTSDNSWQEVYDRSKIQLYGLLHKIQGETADRSLGILLDKVGEGIDKRVELESEARQFVQSGQQSKAIALIKDVRYTKWENFYDNSLTDYLAAFQNKIETLEQEHQELFNVLSYLFYTFVGITVILGLWVTYSVSNYFSRSLINLKKAVEAIGRGELAQRIKVNTKDEIGELGIAFNKMAIVLQDGHTKDRLKEITRDIGK